MNILRIEVRTIELTAHHRDLEALELVQHEGLTVVASVRAGSIEEKNLHLRAVFRKDRRLDVDQEAHEVLLVR